MRTASQRQGLDLDGVPRCGTGFPYGTVTAQCIHTLVEYAGFGLPGVNLPAVPAEGIESNLPDFIPRIDVYLNSSAIVSRAEWVPQMVDIR